MKKIDCSSCHKEVEVPDDYPYKTCQPCLAKDKERYELEKAQSELETKALQLIKTFGLEPSTMPKHLQSFSKFREWFKLRTGRDAEWSDFDNFLKVEKTIQTEKATMHIRRMNQQKLKESCKYLRFDLFEPSHREKCRLYRLQVLGFFVPQPRFLEQHIEEEQCEGCIDWKYNFDNGTLTSLEGEKAYANVMTEWDRAIAEEQRRLESERKMLEQQAEWERKDREKAEEKAVEQQLTEYAREKGLIAPDPMKDINAWVDFQLKKKKEGNEEKSEDKQ